MNEWINNDKNRTNKWWMNELITGKTEQLGDEWMN